MRFLVVGLLVVASGGFGPVVQGQVSPAIPVVVDSADNLVGVLIEGGFPENSAVIALEVGGVAGVLTYSQFNTLSISPVFFTSNDCTGQPHVFYGGSAVPQSQVYGGTFFRVADGGDLYLYDQSDRVAPFQAGSSRNQGQCSVGPFMTDAIPATLLIADFEDGFVPPYRIEARNFGQISTVVSVPAVGPLGLGILTVVLFVAGVAVLRRLPAVHRE